MPGKKFQFSLNQVLRFRRRKTEEAQQALGRAFQQRKEQEARIAEAEARIAEAQSHSLEGPASPLMLRRQASFRVEMQQTLARDRKALQRLHRAETEARNGLLSERRAEESLQSLHDAEKTRHRNEAESAETAFIDEQALFNHYRRRKTPNL